MGFLWLCRRHSALLLRFLPGVESILNGRQGDGCYDLVPSQCQGYDFLAVPDSVGHHKYLPYFTSLQRLTLGSLGTGPGVPGTPKKKRQTLSERVPPAFSWVGVSSLLSAVVLIYPHDLA